MPSEMSSFVAEVLDTEPRPAQRELPFLFVAPMGETVPEDGTFVFQTIDNLLDLAGLPANCVVLFAESQAAHLRVLCSQQDCFDLDVRSIYGVPGLAYMGWFDDASFGAERQMYGPMVAEIRVQQELREIEKASRASGTDAERARYARKDGSVRHANIDVHRAGATGDDTPTDDIGPRAGDDHELE